MKKLSAILPASLFVVLLSAIPNLAQETQTSEELPSQSGRFTFNQTDQGYVRLDSKTGEISVCTLQSGNLVCKLGADERAAYVDALDEMKREINRLQDRLAKLESRNNNENDRTGELESDDDTDLPPEFDTAMEFAQEAMRRFFSVIEDLKKEYEGKLDLQNDSKT